MSASFRRLNLLRDRPSQFKSPFHHFNKILKILVQIHLTEFLIEIVIEVIVTLVLIILTLNIFILALVHTLTIEVTNTLINTITIPTNINTTLLEMILIAALGMTNITKTHILIINPATLFLALIPDITLTLVIVLIVITREITSTLLNPIRLQIAHLLNHDMIDCVLTLTLNPNFNPLLIILNLPLQMTLFRN